MGPSIADPMIHPNHMIGVRKYQTATRRLIAASIAAVMISSSMKGQGVAPRRQDAARQVASGDSAASGVPLFTKRDVEISVGVAAAVLALMPADRSIAHAFQRPSLQSNDGLRRSLNGVNDIGTTGSIAFSAGTYFLGLGMHSRAVASLGMRTGEAIVLGGVITEALKGTFGRARPYVNVTNPHDFKPGKGFSNNAYASLPSGDVMLAFATATAATQEVAYSWPNASRYVTPASYGVAVLVGAARMYKNKHWASDVVAGAAIGTLSGVLFERYNRARPNNVFNRVFLPASIAARRGGAEVDWAFPLQ